MTSETMKGQQLSDILSNWTLDDLDSANRVLDAIEDAQARQMKATQSKAG